MTVGELKEALDDYGDHLTVMIGAESPDTESPRHVAGCSAATDDDGMAAVTIDLA